MSDMTLLSKITNDEVNDNLRKRFECVELAKSIRGRVPGRSLICSGYVHDVLELTRRQKR